MPLPTVSVSRVSVPALVVGDTCIVVDAEGRRLSRRIALAQLESSPEPRVADQWLWKLAAQRLKNQLVRERTRAKANAWTAKAKCLATSFRLRRLDLQRPRSRARFERYPTTTWDDAGCRLWHQANNHYRYHARSGWERWALTVSNNHNKRKGGRYGKTYDRDGQANPEAGREAGLPLCDQWPRPHA